jgi:uncharacterized membrane protein YbhN (UPF0104 family)
MISGSIFAVATIIVIWAALDPRHAGTLARRIAAITPARVERLLDRLIDTALEALEPVRSPGAIVRLLAWSFAAWMLEAGMYLVILWGFMIPGGLAAAVMGTGVANLASLVPAGPGYVGTFDVALKSVLETWFDASPGTAAAYTLVVHAMLVVPVVLAGVYCLWRENLALPDITRRSDPPSSGVAGGTGPVSAGSVVTPSER